jgi:hypothetical protein
MTKGDEMSYSPYFDQEGPEVPVVGMIADLDLSQPYELDAMAVFETGRGYLVVRVSGCSCWPDRGGTDQTVCETKSDVDREVTGAWVELLDACQAAGWKAKETT